MANSSVGYTEGSGKDVAVDSIAGKEHQIIKIGIGAEGTANHWDGAVTVTGVATEATLGGIAADATELPAIASNTANTATDVATIALATALEDTASADAHRGMKMLAVRQDTPANSSNTDGDYEFLRMTGGRLHTLTQTAGSGVAHDGVATSANPVLLGGYASAAAPTSVSADGDAVRAWLLRNGAQATVVTAAGNLINGDATNGLDVDVTRLPALATGSNLIGTINIVPATSGGFSTFHLESAASTNATSVKASAGQLFGWMIYNSNAAARKLAFHNTAGTPTAGASIFFTLVIPPGSAANVMSETGIQFSTGIGITTVTGLADSNSTAVAADDLNINLFYK